MPNENNEAMKKLTEQVLARISESSDPRFKKIMSSLVTKLHEFLRDVDLTPEEWFTAINFLTETGKMCSDKRQEFILLSDTLGLSMMVVMLDQARSMQLGLKATEATEATVEGPYYWEGAPKMPLGANISEGVSGEPTFYSGFVKDINGKPLKGATLDIWSGDGDGNYDMQIEGAEMAARAQICTNEEGRYWFWSVKPSYYPVPMDGPVGKMLNLMGRHPFRPGHIHMKVSAPNHVAVTTHLFVANSPYIESDAVFGVRDSLIVTYESHQPGSAPDGSNVDKPFWTANYDFHLSPVKN